MEKGNFRLCADDCGDGEYGVKLREVVLAMPDVRYISVDVNDTVLEAVAAMEESGLGTLIVLEGGRVAGVLTVRDCAFRLLLEGRDPGRTTCSRIMVRDPYCADANMSVSDCLAYMIEEGLEHAVVSFGGYPMGCVTPDLLLRHLVGSTATVPGRESRPAPRVRKQVRG